MRTAVLAGGLLALLVSGCAAGGDVGRGADDRAGRAVGGTASAATPLPERSSTGPAAAAPARAQGQDELDRALRAAAWADHVDEARTLVERGADVNAKDETQQSAYLVATSEGHLELLDLTLRHGARVDDLDGWDGTGLIRAAERGHHAVVGRLLQAGASRDHVNRIGYQAVHETVWLGRDDQDHVDTLRVLVAGGVQLDRPSGRERLTPLAMARERGHDRLGAVLAAATTTPPADPDASLLAAAASGDADGAARAIRAGADLETRDARRRTPLLLAAAADRVEVARLLVDLGADPDALDDRHDTPWLVTGVTGSVAMLETLLPAGPDLGIENRFGGLSVIPASERGHVDYVRRVVRTGIDVDHVNDLGWTALLEAVVLGDGGPAHQEVVRILLAAGADRSVADVDGLTALDHAEARGQSRVAALLRQ